jgi:drug/metabolite transporter (DMT)-like permease
MITYVAALFTMVMLSLGQVLLKILALEAGDAGFSSANWKLDVVKVFWICVGLCIMYAAAIGCWLYVLRSIELSRAFAFVGLTFVLVPLFSHLILHEKVTTGSIAGSVMIVAGIALSSIR